MSARPRPIARTAGYDVKLERVLAAGARVFAREGYGRATIRQVSAEAGMSLAGLYHYFSSKEELLYLLQHHAFDAIVRELTARLDGVEEPRERLRELIANHLDYFLPRIDVLKVCAHELETLSGELYERVAERRREYFRLAHGIVTSIAKRAGGASVDARTATLYLFGMLNWIYMWYPAEGGSSGDVLTQRLIVLFLDGYLPRPEAGR